MLRLKALQKHTTFYSQKPNWYKLFKIFYFTEKRYVWYLAQCQPNLGDLRLEDNDFTMQSLTHLIHSDVKNIELTPLLHQGHNPLRDSQRE